MLRCALGPPLSGVNALLRFTTKKSDWPIAICAREENLTRHRENTDSLQQDAAGSGAGVGPGIPTIVLEET